jgi:hypothetical protein
MTRRQATATRRPTASRRRTQTPGGRFGWPLVYATQGSNSGPRTVDPTQYATHTLLPRLGQNAPDVEVAPGYNRSCCSGLRSAEQRNDEERLLMQTLSVRWCAGAVDRYEARHTTRFCMPRRARTPGTQPRQACNSQVTHTFEPCFGQRWSSSRGRTWSGGSRSSRGARGRRARC